MHVAFHTESQITSDGIKTNPLYVDMRRGRVIRHSPNARAINTDGYWLLPGFINAHDHLELNHYPRTRFQNRYDNAHQWGEDVSQHLDRSPFAELRSIPLQQQCWIGGLKNLLSGVTTVAHHNPLHRPLRQCDFPVGVLRRYGWAHSLHFATQEHIRKQIQRTPPTAPFMLHLAEGTDDIAAKEFQILQALGGVNTNTVLIHGVGITPADRQKAIASGIGLVWCPSTNQYLLGETADVGDWVVAKRIALGSDSRLTANGDILHELRAAHQTKQVAPETLFHMVTTWAAKLLHLSDRGDLQVGMQADIIAIRRQSDDPHLDLINTTRRDIGLVMRAGKPFYGDAFILEQFSAQQFQQIEVDGTPKLITQHIAKHIKQIPSLLLEKLLQNRH